MRPVLVLFDADCGLCTATASWLAVRAGSGMRAVPLQTAGSLEDRERALLAGRDLRASLHVIEAGGRLRTGAGAMLAAVGAVRGLPGWMARLVDRGPIPLLLEPAYRLVARNRNQLGRLLGIPDACAVPPRET